MAEREVTRTKKDSSDVITALCNPAGSWSPRSKSDVIADIESGNHSYYVKWPEKRTEIRVVAGASGKYLRTDRDTTTRNNLLDLPNC
ncbi:MAG: DUF3892 domain-containing protein [Thermoanaerobaculia bacterium]|nr:DUF3892 domain-containing protein [Thermoanaerobaculia bacterium]